MGISLGCREGCDEGTMLTVGESEGDDEGAALCDG